MRSRKHPTVFAGQVPWGRRLAEDGVTLVPDEYELKIVEVIRYMHSNGMKLRNIVEELKAMRIVGRVDKPLGTTRVFELLHGARKKPPGEKAQAATRTARVQIPVPR